MKFNQLRKGNLARCSLKSCRIMKLGVAFSFLTAFQLYAADSYSQNTKLSLSLKNKTVEQAIDQIEKETGYSFLFTDQTLDVSRIVNLKVKNGQIDQVLSQIFDNTNVDYKIVDKQIILSKKTDVPVIQQNNRTVTGIVTDPTGEPVIGANVVVKGTTLGTITDFDGKFSLEVPEGAVLSISYIGFAEQDIRIGNSSSLKVSLKEDSQALDEVVVVGYTTVKKELLTGAVSSMKMTEELQNAPSITPANALAGKLAGVNVLTANGLPGEFANISIRAKSSWNAQNVLFVIDGMISDATDFNNLSANEIENVTVLKDAASAAIYGSRAAGGVIVVTTKTGSYGQKVKIDYSFNTGFDKRGKEMQLTSGVQTAEYYNRINPNSDPISWRWSQDDIEWIKGINNGWGYDLIDAVWQNPKITTHNIGVSGGSEKVKFYAGGAFTKQEGFLDNLGYKKNNFRLNLTAKLSDNLDVTGQFALNSNYRELMTGGSPNMVGDIHAVYRWMKGWQPDYPIYTDSGQPIDIGWWANLPAQIRGDGGYLHSNTLNPTMNISATYRIPYVKGLSAKASYSKSYTYFRAKDYQKRYKMAKMKKEGLHIWNTSDDDIIGYVMSGQVSKDYLEKRSTWGDNWQYNLQLSYARTFNNRHNLNASLVFEKYESNMGGMAAGVETFPIYNKDQWWATSPDRADSYVIHSAFNSAGQNIYCDQALGRQSWIGQLLYDYDGKYLFNASYRYDGSMNFAPDKRWGFFPSGSVGWVISKESFFKSDVIDFLKLRGSVGLTGNDAIGGWQWQQSYVSSNSAYFGTGDKISSGITYGVLPNENLTWEKSLSYNVGVEMDFLDHFNIMAEYYYTNTYDILGTRSLDVPPTFSQQLPKENYGEVHAQGVELSIGYENKFGDFNVSGAFVASYANANYAKYDDDKVAYDYQKRVGRSLTAVYGYKADGVIRSQEELDQFNAQHPNYNFHGIKPELGQLTYKDLSGPEGKPDGIVDNYDYVMIRNNNNPIVLGLTLGAEWKGLAVNAVFNGNLGKEQFVYNMFDTYDWNRMWITSYQESWSPDNPNGTLPLRKNYYQGDKTYGHQSDFWLKKANFFRLKNLNISYTIPQYLYNRFGLDKVQVYFTGTNVFVISNFNKNYYDPETAHPSNPGVGDPWAFPIMKSYNFGISVTI